MKDIIWLYAVEVESGFKIRLIKIGVLLLIVVKFAGILLCVYLRNHTGQWPESITRDDRIDFKFVLRIILYSKKRCIRCILLNSYNVLFKFPNSFAKYYASFCQFFWFQGILGVRVMLRISHPRSIIHSVGISWDYHVLIAIDALFNNNKD